MPLLTTLLAASLGALPIPPGEDVDPLTVQIDDSAARRFADLWRATGGKPTADLIERDYLASGGRAIAVFTPNRIVNAGKLADRIARNPAIYRDAVERCLPWVADTNAELRATYLALHGLFPDRKLPRIAVVIGANNSGGTAGEGIQVIGLEVICRLSPTREAFQEYMRQFFAHETIHTFQGGQSAAEARSPLLASALREGVADYIADLATARVPNPARDSWAREREAWVWQQFRQDAATVREGLKPDGEATLEAEEAYSRWFGNAGSPPRGWPDELGYWIGMRIAQRYVAQAKDPHAAIGALLDPGDPEVILRESGYGSDFTH